MAQGQRWCIQWWNSPERTARHANSAGRERPTTRHKETRRTRQYRPVPLFILRPTSVRMWHKAILRWVLSQGRGPTRQAVPKMPRTPSAFPFSGCLRRRAINPTPPKRVKVWGDGPLRPEVMSPVVEHTWTNCAARNHRTRRTRQYRPVPGAQTWPSLVIYIAEATAQTNETPGGLSGKKSPF